MKCTPKVRQKTFGVHFKMIFETASFIDYIIQDFCLRNTTSSARIEQHFSGSIDS